MELESSLPLTQMTATFPYPEPDQPSLCLQLCLGLPSGLFLSGFPTKTLYLLPFSTYVHIRDTCPAHLILDFITRTILGEEYRSLSSSLCSFLHFPLTSSLLGPNILLSTLFSNTLSLPFHPQM